MSYTKLPDPYIKQLHATDIVHIFSNFMTSGWQKSMEMSEHSMVRQNLETMASNLYLKKYGQFKKSNSNNSSCK